MNEKLGNWSKKEFIFLCCKVKKIFIALGHKDKLSLQLCSIQTWLLMTIILYKDIKNVCNVLQFN